MRRIAPLLAVLVAIGWAGIARGEVFLDVYAGWASTENTDTRITPSTLFGDSFTHSDSLTAGLRAGWWFLPWLGIAGDVSFFKPDTEFFFFTQDVDVTPLSALLMLRAPLFASDAFPNGRLQPYFGIGPGLFITSFEEDLPFAGGRFDDTEVDAGLDLRAGGELLLLDWLGIFMEYRYTWVEPKWEDDVGGVHTTVSSELATHHLQGGFSFHF